MRLYKRVKQNNRLLFIIEAVHELYLHARSASFPGDEVYVTQTATRAVESIVTTDWPHY